MYLLDDNKEAIEKNRKKYIDSVNVKLTRRFYIRREILRLFTPLENVSTIDGSVFDA